jgi:hypothetical protein
MNGKSSVLLKHFMCLFRFLQNERSQQIRDYPAKNIIKSPVPDRLAAKFRGIPELAAAIR